MSRRSVASTPLSPDELPDLPDIEDHSEESSESSVRAAAVTSEFQPESSPLVIKFPKDDDRDKTHYPSDVTGRALVSECAGVLSTCCELSELSRLIRSVPSDRSSFKNEIPVAIDP